MHADDLQLINPLGGALSKDPYLGGISSEHGDAAVMRYQSELEIIVQGRHIPPAAVLAHGSL